MRILYKRIRGSVIDYWLRLTQKIATSYLTNRISSTCCIVLDPRKWLNFSPNITDHSSVPLSGPVDQGGQVKQTGRQWSQELLGWANYLFTGSDSTRWRMAGIPSPRELVSSAVSHETACTTRRWHRILYYLKRPWIPRYITIRITDINNFMWIFVRRL